LAVRQFNDRLYLVSGDQIVAVDNVNEIAFDLDSGKFLINEPETGRGVSTLEPLTEDRLPEMANRALCFREIADGPDSAARRWLRDRETAKRRALPSFGLNLSGAGYPRD
jgi:hypothetical protein